MRLFSICVVAAVLALTFAFPAMAATPTNPSCWGTVTSQRAVSVGDMGEHSSSFAGEPRLGLGNVARVFGFDHVSELASFLASVDGIEATGCP